ncbi:hypothetical protein Tco_0884734 [Tanacetum coccineum]
MDEVDGKKFVENGFKLNKIDESQVGVHCLEESIMDFYKVCEKAKKSSELESNVSCKVDVDGMANCEEDGKEGDKDEEMSSKYLSGVEDNNTCFVEMTTVVANIRVSVTNVQHNKAYRILENQDNKEDYGVKCNEEERIVNDSWAGNAKDFRVEWDISNFDVMGVEVF